MRLVTLLVFALLAAAPPAHAQAPTEVRVMTFNIWLGGDVVDSGSVIRAIQGAHADIVGLQEAEGNTRKIAQVSPGRVFALANVHLTSDPYGPYLVRDAVRSRA